MINNNIIKNNIIDSGSWIGDNSIPWSKNISGIVYSIDPSLENLEFINLLKLNNNIKNLFTIQKALSNKTQIISTKDSLYHCSFNLNSDGKNKIESCSLDSLFETKQINNIGYIHLDVEGMEALVIEGANKLINNSRPVISFEQHIDSDDYISLTNRFKNIDYIVYMVNELLVGCKKDCRNFLAIPTEKLPCNFVKEVEGYLGNSDVLCLL